MIKDNYVREVDEVLRVIDGDTIIVSYYKGNYEKGLMHVRFLGVNTPERWEDGYYEAKEYVAQVLEGQKVHIEMEEDSNYGYKGFDEGGFGRILGTVHVGEGEQQYNLNDRLLELGLAKVYRK